MIVSVYSGNQSHLYMATLLSAGNKSIKKQQLLNIKILIFKKKRNLIQKLKYLYQVQSSVKLFHIFCSDEAQTHG